MTAGIITAGSFIGDGSALTGIDLGAVTGATGDFSIADKIVHTGDTHTAIRFAGNDIITTEIAGSETLRIDGTGLRIVDKLLHSGDPDTMIRFPAADTFTVETAGSERFRIDSTGRISSGKHGVGTYNDASEWFKVQSNDSAANISIVGSNDTHSSLNLGDEDDFNIQKIKSDHTNNSLQFFTADAERLRITSDGNIGINETSPQQQLHVHDDTTYHGIFVNGSAAPRITFARSTTTTGEWSVGIDGTNGNNFAINNSGDNSNNKIVISSSQVSLYGNVSVPNGNIVMGNTRGIDFSATSDSSGNTSELLDDYEEGSFTPQFDGLSNTPSYAARNGRYTKIGRYVHITGIIQTGGTNPTFSNTSAVLTLTGLPFTGTGVIYYVSLGNVSHQHWDCYGSGNNENNFASGDADFLYCQMEHNTSNMIFMMGKGSQTRARVRNNSMHNSGAIIIFELSYTV